MSAARLVLEQQFAASADRVWTAITDHEGMSRWLDVRVSLLARREGTSVGTVRRIRARGLVIDEEIVYADAPTDEHPGRLVYRVVRGVPVGFHRGEMLVESMSAGRSRLTWDVVLASDLPGLARVALLLIEPLLRDGLRRLADVTARG